MHRFRKKSDAKRTDVFTAGPGTVPNLQPIPFPIVTQEVHLHPPPTLPALPPVSDFRTSLILPDLTRRFTVLRSSTGDPVSLDYLRNRFAQQRAKGAEHQISEEEEDMLLEVLSRIRAHNAGGGVPSLKGSTGENGSSYVKSDPSSASFSPSELDHSAVRQSTQSTTTMSSGFGSDSISGPASPSSRASKRHSNNLFAGQFRDMRYMRKSSNRTIGSSRSLLSTSPSDLTTGSTANALIDSYAESFRPVTPENTTPSVSATSSPSASGTPTRSTILSQALSADDELGPLSSPPVLRYGKHLTNGQLKRMSVSLEEVIKEIEEEADDQVLVPRLLTSTQQNGSAAVSDVSKAFVVTTDDDENNEPQAISDACEEHAATSWGADVDSSTSAGGYRSPSPYRAGGSTSPVPRVPGYIPGMPRPVTPAREMELDDVRSHSTTPRAASPTLAYDRTAATVPLSVSASDILRRGSNASTIPNGVRPSSPLSPLITQRNQGGRLTPEERHRNGIISTDYVQQTTTTWRRPSSPLSSTAFQSLNGGSRPGTPSNVTWNVASKASGPSARPLGRNGTLLGHNKNHSTASIGENQDEADISVGDSLKSASRSPRSPYSPSITDDSNRNAKNKLLNGLSLSSSDLTQGGYSGLSNRIGRSPTPTHDLGSRVTSLSSEDSAPRNQRVLSPLLNPPSPFSNEFQNNPLFISPMSNNSSRSSLVSAGSSYHSWEEGDSIGTRFIHTVGRNEPAWHDIPTAETTINHSYSGSRGQPSDEPEAILRRYTGLSKLDLLSIQSKLLEAVQFRAKNTEPRAPSTLRRRRPSTTQSVHSLGGQQSRTTSPAPVAVSFSLYPRSTDSTAKASALLDSVVDSIQHPIHLDASQTEGEDTEVERVSPAPTSTSSPGRRNKDLTDMLFGSIGGEPIALSPEPPQVLENEVKIEDQEEPNQVASNSHPPILPELDDKVLPHGNDDKQAPAVNGHIPDSIDLMRQVQERTEAAMAQLQRSPQQGRLPLPGVHAAKKRINLQDISSPRLVQSSTSIDKIPTVPTSPLASPDAGNQRSSSIKLSLSKRLRNTLRSKPTQPNGDEVTPWTNDSGSPVAVNSSRFGNRSSTPSKASSLSPGSMVDLNGHKSPNISPPASAGPSLKGFMSRFRKKGQADVDHEQRTVSSLSTDKTSHSSSTAVDRLTPSTPSSAPPSSYSGGFAKSLHDIPSSPSLSRQPTETPTLTASTFPIPPISPASPSSPAALQAFYDAAKSLGLDQGALNSFLAQSQAHTPRSPEGSFAPTALSRDNSLTAKSFFDPPHEATPSDTMSPLPEVYVEQPDELARKLSLRHQAGSPAFAPRRVREIADEHVNSNNSVVRRTIIFPSANGSGTDLSTLVRKASKGRRRASGISVQSNRSVHDRVPTPPPPLRAKRNSAEPSPPVPTLPSSLAWANQTGLAVPRQFPESVADKSNSLYDSLYDMYTGDRVVTSQGQELLEPPKSPTAESIPEMESDQALEVIEMANGETIWSIVNGLRADDAESIYPQRVSLDSEFPGGAHDGDGEQLFFKEHTRTGSKSSNISNFARRKTGNGATANRPETKVFYSSSAHIARLIDQLSRTADAGSFNIKPKRPTGTGHSHSGSLQSETDINWTVEERLEHMLGAMTN